MEDNIMTSDILYNVQIIKVNDLEQKLDVPCYELKQDEKGLYYLAELPLVNHSPEFKEKLFYRYEDLSQEEKEKYSKYVITLPMKYNEIRYYDRPKSWTKAKKKENK